MFPRPFFHPNPPRLHRRKRVTIIAGFQCTDGILVCSDTEESISGAVIKSHAHKAAVYSFGRVTVCVAGAGDTELINYVTQDLRKFFIKVACDWDAIEIALNKYAKRIFAENIQVFAGLGDAPHVSFLLAVSMEKECRLFKWEKNFVYILHPQQHTSIGIGAIQSEALLSEIQFFYPAQQMFFFAVRMMQKVKQLVEGCGGKTEVIFLQTGGKNSYWYPTYVINDAEHLADMVDEFVTNDVLSFISNIQKTSKEESEKDLRIHRRVVVELREKYLKILPGDLQ